MKRKKFLALAMAAAMTVSLAACGDDSGEASGNTGSTSGSTDGSVSQESSSETQEPEDTGKYTLHLAESTFPTNWNPFTYETNTALSDILQYCVTSMYTFDFNDTMDGYVQVPLAAVGEPEDITADYVGKYGVEEGDTAKVWKITMRDDLKWEDGTPITAHDYVKSAELLLNPVANNSRADDYFYGGSFKVVNAKDYLYAGTTAFTDKMTQGATRYFGLDELVLDDSGVYTADGNQIAFFLEDGADWGNYGISAYYEDSGAEAFTIDGVDIYAEYIVPAADEDGMVLVTEEIRQALSNMVAILHGAADEAAYAESAGDYAYQEWEEFCYIGRYFEPMDFSEVGVFALSDTELCYALESPLEGFYLKYALPDVLVNEELYLKCESVTDGIYNNTYGTSVDTWMSYGPYKLVNYQMDKEIALTKNEYYFENGQEGIYETTDINIQYVGESETHLQMFLSGQMDTYVLRAEDMDAYSTSDWAYYSTGASTFFVAMNPVKDLLEEQQKALGDNFNKTILTLKEFRMALSFSLDRAAFALAAAPTNTAAYGMFSDLIIYDPEAGSTYRSTDEAKKVLVEFWGLADEIGEGKMYADMDEAIASITGYNLSMAKEYFDTAYDMAIEQGLMDEDDKIEIKIGMYNTRSFQTKGIEFLQNNWIDAVKGTKLEGKLTFSTDDTIGDDFGNALRQCRVDMLFGVGFSGSALDPYNLMQVYTTEDALRYNICWDTQNDMLTINLNGKDYTASVADWTYTISGEKINVTDADGNVSEFSAGTADNNPTERFQILAALESAALDRYELLPLIDDNQASLYSMKLKMYSEEYIFGVGFNGPDGVKYLRYNYNDAEWDEFVKSQGGTLTYN